MPSSSIFCTCLFGSLSRCVHFPLSETTALERGCMMILASLVWWSTWLYTVLWSILYHPWKKQWGPLSFVIKVKLCCRLWCTTWICKNFEFYLHCQWRYEAFANLFASSFHLTMVPHRVCLNLCYLRFPFICDSKNLHNSTLIIWRRCQFKTNVIVL